MSMVDELVADIGRAIDWYVYLLFSFSAYLLTASIMVCQLLSVCACMHDTLQRRCKRFVVRCSISFIII